MKVLIFPRDIRRSDNPYGELLYRDMSNFGIEVECFSPWRAFWRRYDIFHLHWPEYYLNRCWPKALVGTLLVLLSTAWLRTRGTRILWTVHNPHSHAFSHPVTEAWFWRMFTAMLDGFVSMSEYCTKWVWREIPRLREAETALIPHGHYRESYSAPTGKGYARDALGLGPRKTVLLFFGGVSPYKKVPHLIATFRRAALPNAMMMIAGRADSKKHGRQVEMTANEDPSIRLDLRPIPVGEVEVLFSAADLVVLPFSDIMHSGSAILALSLNKPLLVPATGCLPELQARTGSEWVRTYEGDLTPAILVGAAAWAENTNRAPRPDLSWLDWPHIVQATIELYSRLCARPFPSGQLQEQTTNTKRQVGQVETS
jgi:beta-1,4-mannosyltransferase